MVTSAAPAGELTPAPWFVRRMFPLLATAMLLLIGMAATLWWGPGLIGRSAWAIPHDLWGTMTAARRLAHGDLAGLYTKPTGLISLPGAAVILLPVVLVGEAAGLSFALPSVQHFPQPPLWLLAGPAEIVLSATVLFAADAVAERLGVPLARRATLAAAGAFVLWSVSARWGHPEDAVAVGLLLGSILALANGRPARAAWLMGAALAVQPLVLLAVPFLVMVIPPRRQPGFVLRAAIPPAAALGAAAVANWTATWNAVTRQPNWPDVDHPTPWTVLAPHLDHGAVAAGPVRVLAIVVACACALLAGRRWRAAREGAGLSAQVVWELLWWTALAMALRSLFEAVMVAYYVWPALAVALVAATRDWPRLVATSIAAGLLTVTVQGPWQGVWTWWVPVTAGLAVTLALAGISWHRRNPASGRRPGREMMIAR